MFKLVDTYILVCIIVQPNTQFERKHCPQSGWPELLIIKKHLEIWKTKFYFVCELPAWWKSTQTHLLTKVRDFERSAPSKTWKCKLYSCFTRPLGENYSNSSFDKSKGLNNQEVEKMKSICSNHIFEPTLSNHFLQIDVDLIEKLIPCSLQGGPFGGPACPPVFS